MWLFEADNINSLEFDVIDVDVAMRRGAASGRTLAGCAHTSTAGMSRRLHKGYKYKNISGHNVHNYM